MKNMKKIILSMLLVVVITILNVGVVFAKTDSNTLQEGWNVISLDNICYAKNGVKLTGWQKIYTTEYLEKYLIPDPNCYDGMYSDKAHWYYFDNNGNMKTGWFNDNGTWYYLDQFGVMVTGSYVDGFYLNDSGVYVYGQTGHNQTITIDRGSSFSWGIDRYEQSSNGTNHWGDYTYDDLCPVVTKLYTSSSLDESYDITERQFKVLKESGHIGAVIDYTQVTPDGNKIGNLCFYCK